MQWLYIAVPILIIISCIGYYIYKRNDYKTSDISEGFEGEPIIMMNGGDKIITDGLDLSGIDVSGVINIVKSITGDISGSIAPPIGKEAQCDIFRKQLAYSEENIAKMKEIGDWENIRLTYSMIENIKNHISELKC